MAWPQAYGLWNQSGTSPKRCQPAREVRAEPTCRAHRSTLFLLPTAYSPEGGNERAIASKGAVRGCCMSAPEEPRSSVCGPCKSSLRPAFTSLSPLKLITLRPVH